jgi:hypothetical protein
LLGEPILLANIALSLLAHEDIIGLKLFLKLDIGKQCLIDNLETMPMIRTLTAESTMLNKFFKQQKLVQICNIIDKHLTT